MVSADEADWEYGKSRSGPAAVTGDDISDSHCSPWGNGKAQMKNEPGARTPPVAEMAVCPRGQGRFSKCIFL